jgi:hypothetical protein
MASPPASSAGKAARCADVVIQPRPAQHLLDLVGRPNLPGTAASADGWKYDMELDTLHIASEAPRYARADPSVNGPS